MMKNRLFDGATVPEVLHDNSLEQVRRDAGVPDPLGVYDDNRPAGADAEAWSFAALYTSGSKEQPLAFQQAR